MSVAACKVQGLLRLISKASGKGVLFRADGYKSWRWLRLSINLLNSLFSVSPFYFVIMLRFVQKELEKSSVTKGFVRQQALKEKGGKKRVRLFFLLLCRQGQQWLQPPPSTPYVHVPLGQDLGGDGCRNPWGSLCLGPDVGCGGRTVPPSPCPLHGSWLWGPQLSQKPTAAKPQLLAFC